MFFVYYENVLLENYAVVLHLFYDQWTVCYWGGVKIDAAGGRVKWGNRGGRTGTWIVFGFP